MKSCIIAHRTNHFASLIHTAKVYTHTIPHYDTNFGTCQFQVQIQTLTPVTWAISDKRIITSAGGFRIKEHHSHSHSALVPYTSNGTRGCIQNCMYDK